MSLIPVLSVGNFVGEDNEAPALSFIAIISFTLANEKAAAPTNEIAIPDTEKGVGLKSLNAKAPTAVARISFTLPVTDVAEKDSENEDI